MSVHVVFQWSVVPGDGDACEAAVARARAHISADHPEIAATRLMRQWAGPLPRRAYIWLETYDSLTTIDNATGTSACLEVWDPIERLAQPGTWTTSVWFDVDLPSGNDA